MISIGAYLMFLFFPFAVIPWAWFVEKEPRGIIIAIVFQIVALVLLALSGGLFILKADIDTDETHPMHP